MKELHTAMAAEDGTEDERGVATAQAALPLLD
jgi:hypothetical protein